MSLVVVAVLVLLGAFADRLRGSHVSAIGRSGEIPGALITGLIITYLFGLDWWAVIAYGLAWKIGESVGWSDILGAPTARGTLKMLPENIETWQVGILGTNWWAAAIARGAMWGLPMAIVTHYFLPVMTHEVFLAYVISFVAAPLVAMKLMPNRVSWGLAEWLRGGMAIGLIIIGMHV